MPPVVLGTLELIGLLWLSAALGRRLLRWLRVGVPDIAERGVLATGLGMGALAFLPFALFALGVGHPFAQRAAAGLLTLALLPDMAAVLRAAGRELRAFRAPLWWQRTLLLFLGIALLALYLRALCPPYDGDALSYHLTASLRYLKAGRFVYLPTLTPTNWPLGVEMLYALLLGLYPDSPPAIVQFAFGLVTLAALYLFARYFSGAFAGVAAIVLFLLVDGTSYGGFWHQMSLAMVDVGTTAFTTLAVFTLTAGCRAWGVGDREKPLHRAAGADLPGALESSLPRGSGYPLPPAPYTLLSALFAGLAATTKLTGLWVVVALTVVCGLTDWREGRAQPIRRAAGYGALAAIVVLPWFLKTWAVTGNPFYPMLFSVFGGKEWTAEGWPRYERAHMILNTPPGMPPTPRVLLLSHLVIATLGLLVCLLTLRATRRSRFAIPAGVAAVFLACICLGNYFGPRFLMPVLPCILVCVAGLFQGRERALAPVVCAAAALMTVPLLTRGLSSDSRRALTGVERIETSLPTAARVAFGGISREAFFRMQMPDYPVIEYANRHLPPGARLLVGTYAYNLAYYRAESLWPDYWLQDSIHYDSLPRLESDLRRLGVTYLVLSPVFSERCPKSLYCGKRMEMETGLLTALAQRDGTRLFQANRHTLYALRLPPP
jgi:hypothetical protein